MYLSYLQNPWRGLPSRPYMTLVGRTMSLVARGEAEPASLTASLRLAVADVAKNQPVTVVARSEEHTSELQSLGHLVCLLLLEKKKQQHLHPPQDRGSGHSRYGPTGGHDSRVAMGKLEVTRQNRLEHTKLHTRAGT